MTVTLRLAQQKVLAYEAGRMAVSAVPGSGKTFVLTHLAARLIRDDRLDVEAGQQILLVTYLNASVDNLRARIARRLSELGRPLAGYDVRTLHGLAREILTVAPVAAGLAQDFAIISDVQASVLMSRAVDGWIQDHQAVWHSFLPPDAADSPRLRARWRAVTEQTARDWIRLAKNERIAPAAIRQRVSRWAEEQADAALAAERFNEPVRPAPLLAMLADIYGRYQDALVSQGGLDFDDLVWQAADLLEQNSDVVALLRQRWPYVLEDEAQDSVPLQEQLLETLTGEGGNWVRAGDPNQAITSSFTSAHPRFFRHFLERPDVVERPLPESGRSSRKIINLANHLVEWACSDHPVQEVREAAFRRQMIRPAPTADAQPNPLNSESSIAIRVYLHRERDELPAVAGHALQWADQYPDQTLAILVPTNEIGYSIGEHLDAGGARYDELLRGSGRTREIAAALHAILGLLAHPQDNRWLAASCAALLDMQVVSSRELEPKERERIITLLRSVYQPEALLYPADNAKPADALPASVAEPAEEVLIERYGQVARRFFDTLSLPPDEMVLAVADEIFRHESDLAIAYQISGFFRSQMDQNPTWRLPELVAQIEQLAEGRTFLPGTGPTDTGFAPQPGRITLTTQHRAKGLEWDTVFLVGIDDFWIPGHLDAPFLGVHDFLGGDPGAEAAAQLRELLHGDADVLPGLSATDSAHVEVISERLRLLYVGITRARRNLFISRSRTVTVYQREVETGPASALGALYHHLKEMDG